MVKPDERVRDCSIVDMASSTLTDFDSKDTKASLKFKLSLTVKEGESRKQK